MHRHVVFIALLAALLVFVMLRPFLPGRYDALAAPLSTMVQVFGVAGLLVVPIGIAWFVRERQGNGRGKRRSFVPLAVTGALMVALIVSLAGAATGGASLGMLTFMLAGYAGTRAWMAHDAPRAVALYLVALPVLVLLAQLTLAAPMTSWSRNHAIAQSEPFIRGIEQYAATNGAYPESLAAEWADYETGIVGSKPYLYARKGAAYNVYFEQPRFLLDRPGTIEFVVYNPRGQHMITGHAATILRSTPARQLEGTGWYEARDTGAPHWKSFLFD